MQIVARPIGIVYVHLLLRGRGNQFVDANCASLILLSEEIRKQSEFVSFDRHVTLLPLTTTVATQNSNDEC